MPTAVRAPNSTRPATNPLRLSRPRIAATAAALAVAGLLAWLWWPASQPQPEPPRARPYLEFTACLLTSEHGITEPTTVPVWAGLQDASLTTHAKVQYLAITGPQTTENGLTFLNTLAQTGCNLIFSAGDTPNASVDHGAAQFPQKHFYPVSGGIPAANVTPIHANTPDTVRAAVAQTLITAVDQQTH
jgi:hypothetical protein